MPEVRLIDANALYEKVDESQAHNNHRGIAHMVHNTEHAHFKYMISQAPTIEAEPVRRGHWVLTRDEQYEYCHCSECGYDTGENWMIGSEIPYCSQCGSKNYDGGADNDSE